MQIRIFALKNVRMDKYVGMYEAPDDVIASRMAQMSIQNYVKDGIYMPDDFQLVCNFVDDENDVVVDMDKLLDDVEE